MQGRHLLGVYRRILHFIFPGTSAPCCCHQLSSSGSSRASTLATLLPTTWSQGRAQSLLALQSEGSGVPAFMDARHKQSRASTGQHTLGSCEFQLTLFKNSKKNTTWSPQDVGYQHLTCLMFLSAF